MSKLKRKKKKYKEKIGGEEEDEEDEEDVECKKRNSRMCDRNGAIWQVGNAEYETEKRIADEIMSTVHRLGLPFKLDQLTEGQGNCFPLAIIQQIKRPEIRKELQLTDRMLLRVKNGTNFLRRQVINFITKSKHPRIRRFQVDYERTDGNINKKKWNDYWKEMLEDKVWVEYWFVQATAWYFNLDLWIVDCASREEHPFIRISGNIENEDEPCAGPTITLGTKSSCHYQSLLPIEMLHLRSMPSIDISGDYDMPLPVNTKHLKKSGKDTCENFVINFNEEFKPGFEDPKIASHNIADSVTGNDEVKGEEMCVKSFQNYSEDHKTRCGKKFVGNLEISEDSADDNQNFVSPSEKTEQKEPFKYELSEGMLVFHRMSFDYKMRCPRCQVETKYIIRHVNQNTKCQAGINGDVFKIQFLKYKKETKDMNIVRQEQRERKVKSRARMKAVNNERLKRQQREYEKKSIAAMRALDNENVKQKQRCRKINSRKELRAVDNEKLKKQQRGYEEKSVAAMRAVDNENVKQKQRYRKVNSRKELRAVDNENVKKQQKGYEEKSVAAMRAVDNENVKQKQRFRKVNSRKELRAVDNEKVKKQQRGYEEKSVAAMRAADNENVKQKQKCRKVKSRKELRAVDYEKFKRQERIYKGKSLFKKRAQDNNKVKLDQKILQENHRNINTAQDRLKNFKEATKFNAIFICTCCHQRMFESNVQVFSETFKNDITKRFPDIIRQSVTEPYIISIKDGKKECFICKTCIKYLKLNKMPPMSALNGLVLKETDEDIKNQDLQLTELEAALISKNIIFQKIFQLPKSRWTALKDRVINVPIKEDSILNTLERLPRTPQDAGLIGVALKRKKEYDKTHKHQLVNTEKMYKMLEKLKKNKNPFYQFYDDYNTYQSRCKTYDPTGYEVIFSEDYDIIQDLEDIPKESKILRKSTVDTNPEEAMDEGYNTDNVLEKEEVEQLLKDPVKKYQFKYNESLCMTDKYPEITVNTKGSVEVAPGEGQVPKDIMSDDDWDIKAFPHLHNPDGSNGKDHERRTRLTEQNYFIQRICNKEKRFASSAAYTYAAVAYLEKKQINRNINLSGTRGKQVFNSDGGKTYELDDAHRVLEGMKMTPKYWKQKKYEMLARLDNIGPFQFFFTLSCADMRWDENFAAILLEMGFETKYNVVKDEEGNWNTVIDARVKGGEWKPIRQFIEEDVDESLHEIVRGNVLTATRYFQHRVKNFIDRIIMGRNNPMCVQYYSYKVEFQERGAGHIHGTLWLRLDDLQDMQRADNGELKKSVSDKKNMGELKGLKQAFTRLRKNMKLEASDKSALAKFIDEFTTVSIHENTVGKLVSKIAQEVNKHHHTKTCHKHDSSCRFNYPRFPSPYTVIVEPCNAESSEEKDKLLKEYREALTKVKEVLENEEAVQLIMDKYDKQSESAAEYEENTKKRIQELCKIAKVDYETYLKALSTSKAGYSIVQKRDLDEIFINSYNIEWIRAWDGNMDIQVVLDYFAVITYVTDYYAKDDTGTMEVIKAALAQTDTKDLKEKMKIIANVFLTHRQMGEAEAVYRLIPNMTLTKSNVTCQWVSLGVPDERSSRWRKANEEDCKSGRPVTQLFGHDGFWYEQQDMWSKYLRRPQEVEDICFAQFGKMYRSGGKRREEDDENSEDEMDEYPEDVRKFHYIMTFDKKNTKLPDTLILKNLYPRESAIMQKRTFPAVLRFNKAKRDDPQKFMLHELMLYRPTREEFELEAVESMYTETFEGRKKVDIVKEQVMEHLEGVEEARYHVEQIQKQIDTTETGNKLDPVFEQENADCDNEVTAEHPDFLHIDPGQLPTENKTSNSIYRRVEVKNDNELKENTRALDKYQKIAVNIGVKYAKDIVKCRKEGNTAPKPPLLMVHGGAGAGKSTVINVLAQWTQKILQREGDDIECPCVLKVAFTGTAAANIDGHTLHSSFGFSFDNKHYSLSDKIRDQKRAALKNLKIVIIDEISMVKSDMLYQLDLRLQEITEKIGTPFGGVAIFAFGDMMQLRPVMGRFICEDPIGIDYQVTHAMMPRWKMFTSLILEINHRQGNDRVYAELLNRIRIGKHTQDDMELLKARVKPLNHSDMKHASLFIVCKKVDCARLNMDYILKLPGDVQCIKAKHHHPTQKNYKPYIEPKEGEVASTSFMNELILKLGAKVIIIHNIDTPDKLTNGQLGVLVDMIKTKDGDINKLVIKLNNKCAGVQNRSKHPGLAMKYPECVFIERVTNQYSLRKKSGDVGSSAMVIQFPVKLAFAITSHKIQGQTIPMPLTVVLDIDSVFDDGQAHVMLSRAQQINQVHILNKMDESKIRTSNIGLEESERLAKISMNTNPTMWQSISQNTLKVLSLNCAGLKAHYQDIAADSMVLNGDIIHLIETSLMDEEESPLILPGFECHLTSVGPGKGIATYYKKSKVTHREDFKTSTMQITKFCFESTDLINVYRSSKGNSADLLGKLVEMATPGNPTLITGDFNICYMNHRRNRISKGLIEDHGMKQLVQEPTHIMGGHIDHAYWRDQHNIWMDPILERYSPYYSDHDGLCITLKIPI